MKLICILDPQNECFDHVIGNKSLPDTFDIKSSLGFTYILALSRTSVLGAFIAEHVLVINKCKGAVRAVTDSIFAT